jgi:putative tricarboxylic transport membrane protein
MVMRRYETWAAAFLFLVGLFAAIEARKLSIGEFGRPGAGFFPFYLALVFVLISLGLIWKSLQAVKTERLPPQISSEASHIGKVVTTLLALVVYVFALEWLGYILATFVLMLFLFKAVDPLTWPAAIGGSLSTSLLSYVVFKLWLQVSLPPGLLPL